MLLKTTCRSSGEKYYLRKFCSLIISLALFSVHINAQNGWTKKKSTLHSRIGCCAVVVDNKIYVMGGIDHSLNQYNYNEVYDPMTDTWEAKKSMPTVGGLVSLAVVDGTIYTIGGSVLKGLSEVFAYDPVSDAWNRRANLLSPRYGAAAGVIDGIIYNVGGNHTESNCEAYNPATNTWTRKADVPETYGSVMVASYNGLLYSFGGGYESTLSTTYVYDPGTNEWTKKTDMPTARGWSHPVTVVNGKIYIIGAHKGVFKEILSDVEVYDPVDDSWSKLPDAPFIRTFFGAAAVNNKIYLIGGAHDWGLTGGNEVWEYDLPTLFTQQSAIDKPYAKVIEDSILFRTRFSNLNNRQFTPHLIFVNSDSTQIDSLTLFDDGIHGDSLLNDGLYGCYIPPRETEDYFNLSVSTIENQTNKYFNEFVQWKFTTAGPVKLDSISYRKGLLYHFVKPFVHNYGKVKSIVKPSLRLICNDPWVSSLGSGGTAMLADIAPDSSVGVSSWITISVIDSLYPGYFNFKVEIMSNGLAYWIDSTQVIVTAVEDEVQHPLTFKLEQNYPNPFNPTTTIGYVLQEKSNAKLILLNTIGEEIAVLVNEEQDKGYHKVEFDGSKLTSGVYFYKLQGGNFVETKKMILLR